LNICCNYSKLNIVFILLAYLLSACTYEPTGSHFEEIEVEEPIAFITFDKYQDTLKLFGDVFLQPIVDIGSRRLTSVIYKFDDEVLKTLTQIEQLRLKTFEFSNGNHKFTIEIIANSGTGSLADNYGVEKVLFKKDWLVIIDNSEMKPSKITNVFPYNGNLKIEWEKNDQIHFSSYMLYIFDSYNNDLVFENRNKTSWIDEDYIGGKREFKIMVNGYGSGGAGPTYYYSRNDSLRFHEVDLNEGRVILTWNKNPFFNSFYSYTINKLSNNNFESPNLWESNEINDTIYIDEAPLFGKSYKYFLNTVSRKGFSNTVELMCEFGNTMPEFNSIKIIPENNSIYLLTYTKFLRLDWNTFEIQAEFDFSSGEFSNMRYSISNDGSYFYIASNTKIFSLNPFSLQIKSVVELEDILDSKVYINGVFNVNNKNQLLFEKAYTSDESTFYYDGILLLDMNNQKKVFELSKEEAKQGNNIISDNGEFLLNGFNLHKFINGEYQKYYDIKIYWAKFAGIENFLIGMDAIESNQIGKYSTTNLNLINTISIDEKILSFDYLLEEQLLTLRSNEYFYIYDFSTFQLIHKIKILDSDIFLANENLVSSAGYYVNIQLLL
jgi:hypothetical protein